MKEIQILGTGCSKCLQLAKNAEAAIKELNLPYEIKKVTDIEQIVSFGVMATPALVVDGQVKVVGKVPGVEELKKIIS